MRLPLALFALAVAVALGGCSTLSADRVDYKSAAVGPSLEVPPDLTKLASDPRYQVGSGPVTASGFAAGAGRIGVANTALSNLGDVRIERIGTQRYLVVARTPELIWTATRDFWTEQGFTLTTDQQTQGVLETDWSENRAKIPQDGLRRFLGALAENLYSSGERDKFRTRMERVQGGTEIYISHRGMEENASGRSGAVATPSISWQTRPTDPELEAEFLRRLMVKLGTSKEQAAAAVAQGAELKTTSRVSTINGRPAVEIDDGFDRAWRRVGLSLDRTGFTVEDRDRTNGVYFVRYVAPGEAGKEPGFFTKLFSSASGGPAPIKYRVALKSAGNTTVVSVLNNSGEPETGTDAGRIVKLLAEDLR